MNIIYRNMVSSPLPQKKNNNNNKLKHLRLQIPRFAIYYSVNYKLSVL